MYFPPSLSPTPSRLHAHTHQVPQLITDLCTLPLSTFLIPPPTVRLYTYTTSGEKKNMYIYTTHHYLIRQTIT